MIYIFSIILILIILITYKNNSFKKQEKFEPINIDQVIDIDENILIKFTNKINYDKITKLINKFNNIYNQILSNYKFIKYNYDLLTNIYLDCMKTFRNIEFNIIADFELHQKFKDEYLKLHTNLKSKLDEIKRINNNNILENGYSNHKSYIYDDLFNVRPYNLKKNEYLNI